VIEAAQRSHHSFKRNAGSPAVMFGKMRYKVTNWAEYEAGLYRRGSPTLGMTLETLSSRPAPK
jgi:hypothetical protein